jgi:HAD superfamily 5'-nucleotidase-like hydrolase
VFCNRTLNFRALKAIGYDMDYTLVDYQTEMVESLLFAHALDGFQAMGWPIEGLRFCRDMVARGLVIDAELGNVVKANSFGFIKKAAHGTRQLEFEEQRAIYAREIVDPEEPRWIFLNTLFSLSEGSIYSQFVDLLDMGLLPHPMGYMELYKKVRDMVDAQHADGRLKPEILRDPQRYLVAHPDAPPTLLDQFHAGKRLVLVTNSDWAYTSAMMAIAFDPFLPNGMKWRDLFDLVIVDARKPDFFTMRNPFFRVESDDGLLKPAKGRPELGSAYVGGCAALVEEAFGVSGDEILYVGDHLFTDVHVTKSVLRWRTALILSEIDEDISAVESFAPTEREIAAKMAEKEALERQLAFVRVSIQRLKKGYGAKPSQSHQELEAQAQKLRSKLLRIDEEIAPLATESAGLTNPRWGLLTRAGNDKSLLADQVERYADIYTSRVSNLGRLTPFAFIRSARGSLPHDSG